MAKSALTKIVRHEQDHQPQ
jgi:hypothetical protein